MERAAYLLEVDSATVGDWYARGGLVVSGDPLEQLGLALASSAPLETSGPWALSVSAGAPGLIGAIGEFGPGAVTRLEALRWQVQQSLERLLYLDDSAVAEACALLAERVRERLGPDALGEARFTAVPRGGHLVLGRLAYLLDLDRDQLDGPQNDRPWVVVDDCSISGLRFRGLLDRAERSDVVFAHLCSHPDLREAVERDPRVRGCVAGRDLHDHAPASLGHAYPTWRSRWDRRQQGRHFWLGKPDHVCFPWNEPDVMLWNPLLEREDPGWRVVPPEYCLKNQVAFERGRIDIQTHAHPGPMRPGPGVTHARLGDEVVVARIGRDGATGLSGSGADMWDALVMHGTISASARVLAQIYDVSPDALESDLRTFANSLEKSGLLDGSVE